MGGWVSGSNCSSAWFWQKSAVKILLPWVNSTQVEWRQSWKSAYQCAAVAGWRQKEWLKAGQWDARTESASGGSAGGSHMPPAGRGDLIPLEASRCLLHRRHNAWFFSAQKPTKRVRLQTYTHQSREHWQVDLSWDSLSLPNSAEIGGWFVLEPKIKLKKKKA